MDPTWFCSLGSFSFELRVYASIFGALGFGCRASALQGVGAHGFSAYYRVLKGGVPRGVCNARFPNTPYYSLSLPKLPCGSLSMNPHPLKSPISLGS